MDLPDFSPAEFDVAPLERAETIPSTWYCHPGYHDLDLKFIHHRTWQYIGHESRLSPTGSFIVGTAGSNPVIVVRNAEGRLHAFYNVCRHRGGPLAMEDGCARALQCKYHGWTYTLDGHLRGVPKFDRSELFDKKDYGLIPLRLAVWQGLVFVHLSTQPADPLEKILEGIAERIRPIELTKLLFYKRVTYDVACNWKVYVDNYLEGYHLPFVHPELTTLLDYQSYVTETHPHYSLQYSPIARKDSIYNTEGGGEAFYYFVYPNFMLNILPNRLQTNAVIPLAHDRCRVVFDYYYDDVTSPEAVRRAEDDLAYSDKVQAEDIEICEYVQRGLRSDGYSKGRFSPDMESGVYHFQCLLKKSYARAHRESLA